jgi:hypothetical protein
LNRRRGHIQFRARRRTTNGGSSCHRHFALGSMVAMCW